MSMDDDIRIEALAETQIADVVALIERAMNADEARWADTTIRRHFQARACAIDDGRSYWVMSKSAQLIGITGLHHYEWGPPGIAWLGWFAVDPNESRNGHGARLLEATERIARDSDYSRLFIESYDSPTFQAAISFYERMGYAKSGTVDRYLSDGSPMVVLAKDL